ncbi:GIY-YIG nuclease family protein [Ottowia sp.]|uniref:GIY-YIG nuclease family protein n=1 Tax=Ottowia sp. TaxID=1898956 RepID=UPI0039E5CC60
MNTSPKTIQIYLPNGSPTGIRVAEITTRIVQLIDVPRKLLPEFLAMPESKQVALYFLVSKPDDGSEPKVYVGQTGDLKTRLGEHDSRKDFWERALVLVSRTHSLTQTHALFLEWQSIQTARKAGRYVDLNGTGGSRPHTPAPLEADCLEIFETGGALLATLGHPIFEPVVQTTKTAGPDELFYCKTANGDVSGKGIYTQEGFVVLASSRGRKDNVPSIAGTSDAAFRQKLIDSGVMKEEGDQVVFVKDHLFRSPSTAAVALFGRTANGWIEWKNQQGDTLDAVKRQAVNG